MAVKAGNKDYSLKKQAVLKLWPVAALVVSIFIPVSFYVKDYYSGMLQSISLIILFIAVYVHSISKTNTWLISNILASLGLTVILPWIFTGGAGRTGLWFSIPYVCWVFFLNKRGPAIFWLSVYVIAAVIIAFLSTKGIVKIAYSHIELLNMLLIYLLTFVLLYLFDIVRDSQVQQSKDEIEERKKSEERLQIANEQLFVFFNLNPVATYIASSSDERFRFVNKAFLKLFSLEREMIIGKTALEIGLIKAEELQRLITYLNENESHFAGFEYKMKTVTGETLDILGYNEAIKLDGEDYYIGTMQNISEIKETEEKLRKLSEFQDIMLNGTDYSIFTTDAETGIILSFNKGAEKMLGYTAEEIIGKTSPGLFHDFSEVIARANQLSEELQIEVKPGIEVFRIKSKLGYDSDTHEWTNIRKDGVRITVELTLSPLRNKDKKIFAYIGIGRDISKQKKLQNELIKAKQIAEESVILKEAFLANMSHEIRTPMNAIIGFTDLLLKKNLPAKEIDYVQTIKKSGENLLRIINDILDVSKIDSGMMEFEEHPISIKEIFNSLNVMLSQKAKEKKLKLEFGYDPSLPGTVLGDPTRLTQIILNLVGNAIKFTKTGGISVYARLLKQVRNMYQIEFFVKDSGIGIPEDKLKSIFDRFSQAEAHTTRNYGGTGLGLSIAKQLVALQGGVMNVSSKVGSGSVFSFTMFFKKTTIKFENNQPNYDGLDMEKLSELMILVAEDNPINIKFVESLFADYKIKVDIAENGKIAIEKIKSKTYDLILMDIEMPEMNGYETTYRIRHDLNNDIPIIAMTAHAMAGEQDKCLALGMNDYISKPVNANLLFEKMLVAVSPKIVEQSESAKKNKVINLDFLIESMAGKKDVIRETIDIFLSQVPEDVIIINEAVNKADYLRIKNYAHKMKSTASLIGMRELEPVLAEMEILGAQKKDIKKIEVLNKKMNKLCEQGVIEMQQERLNYV